MTIDCDVHSLEEYCLLECNRLTFSGLQDVISQKIILFITTAVRTPNPTFRILFQLRFT
jgi:hypothetical protein